MLRKIMWANVLALSLLMMQCGQTENANSGNSTTVNTTTTTTVNRAATNSANSTTVPGAGNANLTPRPNQERVPPPEKMPNPGDLGNDANLKTPEDKPAPNTNANTGKKPRIDERKPPEREQP